MNYRLVAVEVGDALKWDTSVNQIDRKAQALFRFNREDFPADSITSVRAQLIHDWILTLAKQRMEETERNQLLITFCRSIAPEEHLLAVDRILENAGISRADVSKEALAEFLAQNFHAEVHKHSKDLYVQGNFFHAVFEACKAYNKLVQAKSNSTKDGQALMLGVWGGKDGVLKVTPCESQTDLNVQDGVKFLSAGMMAAVRNPTAHEPALDWPIDKQDCLDLLGFLSFLFRKLDIAVYYKAPG